MKEFEFTISNGQKYRLIPACSSCPKDIWSPLKERELYTSILCEPHAEAEWHKYLATKHIRAAGKVPV